MDNNIATYIWLFLITIIVSIVKIFIDYYRSRKTDKILSKLAGKKDLKEFSQKEVTTPEKTVRSTRIKFWKKEEYKGTENF